jgi:ubiquitin-conjugating enzyme E2 J1
METDPKGQLGGLDASDAVRRRMAGESRGWRCPGCKRSNEEIIRDCEEKAKEVEEKDGIQGMREEVEVPKDLKMGWRDEMEASAEAASAKSEGQGLQRADDDSESAELAEGFVQTIPIQAAPALDASIPIPVRSSPAQAVSQPIDATGSSQAAALAAPALPLAPQALQQRRQDDGVPVWIDRLIVVIGVVLVAMVLRIVFAL